MKRFLLLAVCILFTATSPALSERERAQHALDRLAFGGRPGDVELVMRIGVDKWIAQQLHPERIPDQAVDARLAQYATLAMSSAQIFDQFEKPILEARRAKKNNEEKVDIAPQNRPRRLIADLSAQRLIRATDSERQLNEVMVDFWLNHFNVFAQKGLDRVLITSYERDTIRPHVWGKFEDLLLATAKSPAMLFYLDNARSRNGAINENYAREIMELHTLGVDGGYTQKDVTELARVFTGWSIARSGAASVIPSVVEGPGGWAARSARRPPPRSLDSARDDEDGFVFRRFAHDRGEKTVLGVHFRAGGGMEEGERMIHLLAHHPATAHHIAYQLCQRFIADEPPASAVDRVAKVFLATDGDLRQTLQAVIDSPEFWQPKYYRAKMKTPFEYAVSAIRAVDGCIDDPLPVARQLQQMGEGLYLSQPPTGYSDTAAAWSSSGGLMARLNFATALAENKLPGVRTHNADPKKTALFLGSPEFQKQ